MFGINKETPPNKKGKRGCTGEPRFTEVLRVSEGLIRCDGGFCVRLAIRALRGFVGVTTAFTTGPVSTLYLQNPKALNHKP